MLAVHSEIPLISLIALLSLPCPKPTVTLVIAHVIVKTMMNNDYKQWCRDWDGLSYTSPRMAHANEIARGGRGSHKAIKYPMAQVATCQPQMGQLSEMREWDYLKEIFFQ